MPIIEETSPQQIIEDVARNRISDAEADAALDRLLKQAERRDIAENLVRALFHQGRRASR